MTTTPEVLLPELPSYFTPGSTAEAQMHDYARAAVALNRRAGVPEGWELVPREPTAAMLNAAACTPHDNTPTGGGGHPFRINMARKEYAALLAAAPQPPVAPDGFARCEAHRWRDDDTCDRCGINRNSSAQPEPGAVTDKEIRALFHVFCEKNPVFDFDTRPHTHGGPFTHGGYYAHEKTRAAWRAFRSGYLAALSAHNVHDPDEDAHVIATMGNLLARIAITLKGPEPAGTKWSYHDLPDLVSDLYARSVQGEAKPVAWESSTPAYTRYITEQKYQALRPEARRWYKPYKCANCTTPQPAVQWQPMETAPKDGTTVLAYRPSGAGFVSRQDVVPVHWSDWGGGEWENSTSGYKIFDALTHWKPLPAAPTAAEVK